MSSQNHDFMNKDVDLFSLFRSNRSLCFSVRGFGRAPFYFTRSERWGGVREREYIMHGFFDATQMVRLPLICGNHFL